METQLQQTRLANRELSKESVKGRNNDFHIALHRVTIIRILVAIAVLLVAANIVTQSVRLLTGHAGVYGLVPLFNLDAENNLPSYFSAALLLIAAIMLHIIALFERRTRTAAASKWTVLGWIFLYLSADEAAGIHELLIRPTRELLGKDATTGFFLSAWVIPGLVLTSLFAWWFLDFFWRLPRKVRSSVLLGAVLYIGGAIGMEMVSIWYWEQQKYIYDFTYTMLSTVEESLEMVGVIVFISALMSYMETSHPEVRFRFSQKET